MAIHPNLFDCWADPVPYFLALNSFLGTITIVFIIPNPTIVVVMGRQCLWTPQPTGGLHRTFFQLLKEVLESIHCISGITFPYFYLV